MHLTKCDQIGKEPEAFVHEEIFSNEATQESSIGTTMSLPCLSDILKNLSSISRIEKDDYRYGRSFKVSPTQCQPFRTLRAMDLKENNSILQLNSQQFLTKQSEAEESKLSYLEQLPSIASFIRPSMFLKDFNSSEKALGKVYSHSSSPTSTFHSIKPKRKRTSTQQLKYLQTVFDTNPFPSTDQRIEMGKELGMHPRSVQIWFQNKRQSLKQKIDDSSSS
jgi:hypothetical protein